MGPSAVLHIGDHLWVMLIGMFCIGIAAAFTVIPIIPEMLDSVEGKYHDKAKVKDISSGIFNMANGLGQIAGPAGSGALKDKIGFAYTTDLFAGILACFVVIYFLFCEGFTSLIRSFSATRYNMKHGD